MNGQAIASLTLQLQKSLDSNYDVTDMQTVLFVIQQLEGTTITKEQLETTRLAFYINQLRRRTFSQTLARRAKNLLKKWRDMVMPALQQPSASQPQSTAAAPPPSMAAATGLSLVVRSPQQQPHNFHQQSNSQPPMSAATFASSSTPMSRQHLHSSQQQQTIPTHVINKIRTGSANNHYSRSSKSSSALSNGSHYYQIGNLQQRFTMPTTPEVIIAAAARAQAAADYAAAAAAAATTPTISPPATEIIDISASITKTVSPPDGKFYHAKKQQPTSFANLLTSQSQPPISYSNTTTNDVGAAAASSSNSSNFIDLMRRSESPTVTLPRITRMMNEQQQLQHRQSPVSSLLDFDSNPSSRSRVVSPTIQSNNSTSSKRKAAAAASSLLMNGDDTGGSGVIPPGFVSAVLPSAYDFHDSNSTNTMDAGTQQPSTTLLSALHQAQHSRIQLLKCYSMPAQPVNAVETFSSSNHRKSKKHKKDKKRNKQSPDEKSMSQAAAASASSILQQFVEDIPAASEETMMTSVPGAAATVIFPPHDSLSSSSMSLFPSTSTNTMMVQNTSRMLPNNYSTADNPTESDLTFAGKFKSSSTTAAVGGSGSGVPSIASSTNNSSFDTVLSPASGTTKKSSEKEADLIVVVESRSCSPYIGHMALDDSCSSSSRATIPDIVNVIHQDSDQCGAESMKAVAAATVQATLQQTPIAKPAVAPVEAATAAAVVLPGPKKRGRKKGSRGIDAVIAQTHAFLNTPMFERPRLLFAGSKKVKTTKELLADIQSRKLGSSATSSPTLPFNRQSASPSTCSEASLQSDITNIRTSLNPRSPPEFSAILTNYRQSDPEDLTDSNDAVGPPSSKNISDPKSPDTTTTGAAYSGGSKTVDEYLNELNKMLHAIDYSKLHWKLDPDEDVLCTCTVREIEPAILPPKEEVIIFKSDDDEDDVKPALHSLSPIESKAAVVESTKIAAVVLSTEESPMLPTIVEKSPKKQIKSIFDLDYDDDNDPLHTIVEAAKLRNETTADELKPVVASLNDERCTNDSSSVVHVVANSLKKSSVVPGCNSGGGLTPSNQMIPAPTSSSNGEQQRQFDANAMMMSALPQYEVIEDDNCLAKYRYDIQTNCITDYHINALHNLYIPNVNGNWNASVPMNSDHRKKLRRRRTTSNNDDEEDSKLVRRRRRDSSGSSICSASSADELYERVVPQYDYINKDKVLKDLSQVKFTKNFLKKKLDRDAAALLSLASNTAAPTKSENVRNSCSRKSSKRKRLKSDSNSRDTIVTAADDGVKHKHQRRKKHRKLLNTKLDNNSCIDSSLSNIKEDVEQVVEFTAGNNNNNNNVDEIVEVVLLNDKLTLSDDTDNACDFDDESHAALVSSLQQKPIENYGLSIKAAEDEYDVVKVVDKPEPMIDEITFIESSSNSSNSCNSGVIEVVNKYNSQVSTSSIGNNNSRDLFDEYINDDDDCGDDVDNEYDADDDGGNDNDAEHEVVTHDMTSSTSTTSQQHIVLTIKKKVLRSSEDNENAMSLTPPSLAQSAVIDSIESMNVTSTSPTTIRLRRIHKTPKQIVASVVPQPIIVDSDKKILQIFDNNNIKVNLNNRMAVSSKGNVVDYCSSSPAVNLVLVDGMAPMSSSNLILPQQQQHDTDKASATDNFNSLLINLSSNKIKINDIKNRCNDGENSSRNNQAVATTDRKAEVTEDNNSLPSKLSLFSAIEKFDREAIDNDSNDSVGDLPKENNQLLKTFNALSEDNRIGVRLMPTTSNTNNNTSAKINRNSSDSCEQQTTTVATSAPDASSTSATPTATTTTTTTTTTSTDQVQEFKEWHEVLQVRSYNDELLTILPYVVID